jgi:exodeoxyribonuclease VIII
MNDLMIDIETLGTKSNSVITQIGAVFFDRNTGKTGEELSVNIQIQDCLDKDLQVDGGAIKFWLEQSGRSFLKNPVTLQAALDSLRKHYKLHKDVLVWAHATFDFPILANAYDVIKQGFAFPYRNLRDIRTLVDLAKLDYKKLKENEGVDPKTHDALSDCIYQVKYCTEAFNKLRKSKDGTA